MQPKSGIKKKLFASSRDLLRSFVFRECCIGTTNIAPSESR
jgi:hypothetical protein